MLVRPISVLNLSLGSRVSGLGSRVSGLGLWAPGLEVRRAVDGFCDLGHLRLERSAKGNKNRFILYYLVDPDRREVDCPDECC